MAMTRCITILLLFASFIAASDINTVILDNGKLILSQEASKLELITVIERSSSKLVLSIDFSSGGRLVDATLKENILLLLAEVGSGVHRIVVYDITKQQIIDSFYGGFPSLSPDGRFVVFQRYLGRYGQIDNEFAVGETRLYDSQKPPSENRTKAGLQELNQSKISKISHYYDVGIPVYPLGDYEALDYGFAKSYEGRKGVAVLDKYYWYNNVGFVFFTIPKAGKYTVVRCQFDAKTKQYLTIKNELDLLSILGQNQSIDNIEVSADNLKITVKNTLFRITFADFF